MQRLDSLLILGLNGNETHGRAGDSFADCSGIVAIILLPTYIGLHISWRDQLHSMAELADFLCPVVDVAQLSIPTRQGFRLANQSSRFFRISFFWTMTWPSRSIA